MTCPYAGKVPLQAPAPELAKKTMKAVVVEKVGGPEVLTFTADCPVPAITDNEVLIKVMTAGLNPCDVDIRDGNLPGISLPYIPGMDLSGYVEQVGSEVTTVKVGDPVYSSVASAFTGHSAYAEYSAVNQREIHPLPQQLNFSQGACLGLPYFSAYRALFTRGYAKPGERVLVHGDSGGVGMAACQFGRAYGLHVVGTAGSEAGLAFVKACGAEAVFNHKQDGYIDQIRDHIGSEKFQLILEMKADSNLQNDLSLLAEAGKVIVIGCHGDASISPLITMFMESDIKGLNVLKITEAERAESVAAIARGAELGWLAPRICAEFPLTHAADAHRQLSNGGGCGGDTSASGKIILSTV